MSTRAAGSDFRRTAGLAGVVSAVLLVITLVATFAQGAPPALDASSQGLAKYFSNNEGLAKVAAFFGMLPILTLPVWFVGWYLSFRGSDTSIGDLVSGAWARVALIAFIALGAFSTVQGAATFAIVLGIKDEFDGQPAVAGALFDLYNALGVGSALAMTLLLWAAATCHGDARDRGPSWLKTALYAGTILALVSFFAPFLEIDALAFAGLFAFLVFIAWVAVTGLSLLKPGAATTNTTRGAGTGI